MILKKKGLYINSPHHESLPFVIRSLRQDFVAQYLKRDKSYNCIENEGSCMILKRLCDCWVGHIPFSTKKKSLAMVYDS